MNQEHHICSSEDIVRMREMKSEGIATREIAKKVGCHYKTVMRYCNGMAIKKKPVKTEQPEGTVRCTKCVSKTCLYGDHQGCCNYILVEGHRRGCKSEACDKYVKADAKERTKYYMQKNVDNSWRDYGTILSGGSEYGE